MNKDILNVISVEPSTRFDEDVHQLRISMRRMGEGLQAAAQDAADAIRPFFDALADELLRRR